jgi:uncharacterized coiled-coil DUF342 family protein
MTRTIFLIAAGITVGALIAKQNESTASVDSVDLIIEKSKQTMQQASQVSAKVDKQVSEKIGEMKQTIEVLEEEKELLVEQVTEMKNEITTIKSAPVQPFDVLAIGVSDTANRR